MLVAQLKVNTNRDLVTHEKKSTEQRYCNGERCWHRDGDTGDGGSPCARVSRHQRSSFFRRALRPRRGSGRGRRVPSRWSRRVPPFLLTSDVVQLFTPAIAQLPC